MMNISENIAMLARYMQKPELFSRTEALFWDDPYISSQMLAAHLDSSHDMASRRPETIDRSVQWMLDKLGLKAGQHILDMGCGPGLYCQRFAKVGLQVTGVDYSQRSINYAIEEAKSQQLPIDYHYQNYLELTWEAEFDAVCLIWCDFGALTDNERKQVLNVVHKALKPGGIFIFDVLTMHYFEQLEEIKKWEAQSDGGFWRPDSYLEFKQIFLYPEAETNLTQYLIWGVDNSLVPYNIWNRCFSPESINSLLAACGFTMESHWSDLQGTQWAIDSDFLGVIAYK